MKITIVGAGNVGAMTAQRTFAFELANEVVLLDVVNGMAHGKALDMAQAAPLVDSDCRLIGTSDYDATAGSDIVVITAGLARRPGMSYDDLLVKNAEIVREVTRKIVERSPQCILIPVSHPLDEMTYVALEASGFRRHRVIGMSGVLDSARLRSFVAQELDVAVEDVSALVIGTRSDMVPLVRYTTVAGIPLSQWISQEQIKAIIERARNASNEILDLLKTVSAFYAPSAAITAMIEAIVRNKRRIIPCAVLLNGEYGLDDVVIGTLAKIGRRGIEQIVEIDLLEEEFASLQRGAQRVRDNIAKLS
jgi:malate dehydrogenase